MFPLSFLQKELRPAVESGVIENIRPVVRTHAENIPAHFVPVNCVSVSGIVANFVDPSRLPQIVRISVAAPVDVPIFNAT